MHTGQFFKLSLILLLAAFFVFCETSAQKYEIPLIPRPSEYEFQYGDFELNERTQFYVDTSNYRAVDVADYFQSRIRTVSGMKVPIKPLSEFNQYMTGVVVFRLDSLAQLGNEGYELDVARYQVNITAKEPAGLFYAVQTIRQLLPVEFEHDQILRGFEWKIPGVHIKDVPKYKWRGLHLDTGRHVSSVSFIKKYLDNMALHKLNTFHWHLTEDQGWRLEIKKYPRLTEVGAFRDSTLLGHYGSNKYDGKRYGGFYTQEEAREIVEYARSLFITVVPEIEMPGHATAAIAAYPELGNTNRAVKPVTTWGVFPDIFNVEESTFNFLEDVLSEVINIFPSEYIHIGGDEAPKDQWKNSRRVQAKMDSLGLKDEHELQSYFIKRIESYLNDKGRQIIGWDEILEGGLAPNAAVMSWRGEEGGIAAAKSGHQVVMSPNSHLYFDHAQGDVEQEPLSIGGYLPLEKVYSYDPTPAVLNARERDYILGAQANLWTEYLPTNASRWYMLLPRVSALSEVVWSGKEHKNWSSFKNRLPGQFKRYEAMGLPYAKTIFDIEINAKYDEKHKNYRVNLHKQWDGILFFTTDGSAPTSKSKLYSKPLELKPGTTIRAGLFKNGKLQGKITSETLRDPKAKN